MLDLVLGKFFAQNPGAVVQIAHTPAVLEELPGPMIATHVIGAPNMPEGLANPAHVEVQSMDDYKAAVEAWGEYVQAVKDAQAANTAPPDAPAPVVLFQKGAPIVAVKDPAEVTLLFPIKGTTDKLGVRGPFETVAQQAANVFAALEHTKGDLGKALAMVAIVPSGDPPP